METHKSIKTESNGYEYDGIQYQQILSFDTELVLVCENAEAEQLDSSGYFIIDEPVFDYINDNHPQIIADCNSFIENIDDLLQINYNFPFTGYTFFEEETQRYFDYFAENFNLTIGVEFGLKLSLLCQPPKQNADPQEENQPDIASLEPQKPLNIEQIPNLKACPQMIRINNTLYDSFESAYLAIDQEIENVLNENLEHDKGTTPA